MCGYAVEWARRCYRSKWRLHPDNPALLVEGRYYFVAEGTPFYPGLHQLGSRDWTSDERDDATIGEYDGPQEFDRGDRPLVAPEVIVVGSRADIAAGGADLNAPTTTDAVFDRFLPPACYEALRGTPGERIARCPDRSNFAVALSLVNDGPWEFWARRNCSEAAVAELHREEDGSLFSSYAFIKDGNECHIYIDGTRNNGQLLAQAYTAGTGPRSFTNFNASALYHANALRVLRAASRFGCDSCTRFILIGHSYGGATATVAAAILRNTQPNAQLAIITEGAPRAGGDRLVQWLKDVPQRHYRRPLDPIPLLPPQRSSGGWLYCQAFEIVALLKWAGWGEFADYRGTFTLRPDGSLGEENAEPPPSGFMENIALQINANLPIGSYAEHFASAYADEMVAGCGET